MLHAHVAHERKILGYELGEKKRKPTKKSPRRPKSKDRKKIKARLRLCRLSSQKNKAMKKSAENILALLRKGVPVKLLSDDFRFSELSEFARISSSAETDITLVVGDNLNFAEVMELANVSHGHIHIDISRT